MHTLFLLLGIQQTTPPPPQCSCHASAGLPCMPTSTHFAGCLFCSQVCQLPLLFHLLPPTQTLTPACLLRVVVNLVTSFLSKPWIFVLLTRFSDFLWRFAATAHLPQVSWFNSFNKQKWVLNLIYHKVCFERKRANLKEWIWVFARTLCVFRRAMLVWVLVLSKWLHWETPGVEAVKKKKKERKCFWLCSDICSWSLRPLCWLDSIFQLKPQWMVCSTHSECWVWSLVIWFELNHSQGITKPGHILLAVFVFWALYWCWQLGVATTLPVTLPLTYKAPVQWVTLWEKTVT